MKTHHPNPPQKAKEIRQSSYLISILENYPRHATCLTQNKIPTTKFTPLDFVHTAFIDDIYSKCGQVEKPWQVFD
jgi:hypothetical protein